MGDHGDIQAQVHVDINEDVRYLTAIVEAKIKPMPPSSCCIFRVPEAFRGEDKGTYEPKILSIGPFHHGEERLQGLEKYKKWYLHAFLSRSGSSTDKLVKAIWDLELEARECYAEPIDHISRNEFVQIMLFDGCFILELLYRYNELIQRPQFPWKYDHIFKANWMLGSLCHDLILLENQLPFIVLDALFNLSNAPKLIGHSLDEHIAIFFKSILRTKRTPVTLNTRAKHLLDFLRNHLFPLPRSPDRGNKVNWEFTKCVTNLMEAGVKVEKKAKPNGLLDIEFSENGVLKIPPFSLRAGVSFVLLSNLVALEQCQGYDDKVTSYVVLLDNLINSSQDVELLSDKGIIDCSIIETEKVSTAINDICKGVDIDMREFYYDGLCNKINAYCREKRHRWRASLKRDYFNNPWTIISVIAAIILLLLTSTQTLFSVLSYPPFH